MTDRIIHCLAVLTAAAVLVTASASAAPVPRWTGEASVSAWIGPDADQPLEGPFCAVPHGKAAVPALEQQQQRRAVTAAAAATANAGQWPAADDGDTSVLLATAKMQAGLDLFCQDSRQRCASRNDLAWCAAAEQ